jgi:hypothetical protein
MERREQVVDFTAPIQKLDDEKLKELEEKKKLRLY